MINKIKILFIGSNPSDQTRIRIDTELREIESNLRLSNLRDKFELVQSHATRPRDLLQAMLDHEPAIVHFSGHGNQTGICLEDEIGNTKIISNDALTELFKQFSDKIECIILNSCYSEEQACTISEHISYVVGMQSSIPDNTALEYAVGFYKALGSGKDYSFAHTTGVTSVKLAGLSGSNIPLILQKENKPSTREAKNLATVINIEQVLHQRLESALCSFSNQPIIWVEPVLSTNSEISQNPNENLEKRKKISEIITGPKSTIIKAPPQFGLTSLSHFLIKSAWTTNKKLWIYINSEEIKPHKIENYIENEVQMLGFRKDDIECIVLDSWDVNEHLALKKLRILCDLFKDTPLIVMQRIDDYKFFNAQETEKISREFDVLHLLALHRSQIRQVVSDYNSQRNIGEDSIVLAKIVKDLECLNMHRTPHNCLTLLKVSEKYFDESPVNRTNMLERVLFILFNTDDIPTYKTKPDLKDCEYVLGRLSEQMIKSGTYEFTRDFFLRTLNDFCKEKLFDLEVDVLFDILLTNNIIIKRGEGYGFKSSFWILFFAAKRMHIDSNFSNYIFEFKKYRNFPEIIEFYTGIDRNRSDALKILLSDIRKTCDVVLEKVGIPDNLNPYVHAKWDPTREQVEKMRLEIGDNVMNSHLPVSVKDQFAENGYNQLKPYDQSIHSILEEYSLYALMQEIKATSRALRNCDYVDSSIKKEVLKEIVRSWEQISKILFVLSPMLAIKGKAQFEDVLFLLADGFGDNFEDRLNGILQTTPSFIVGYFRNDISSNKLGPLLFDYLNNEKSKLKKHKIALMIISERPREWKSHIEDYIISLPFDSFFLFDTLNCLQAIYKYDFLNNTEVSIIDYLIKKAFAKNYYKTMNPGLEKIKAITNKELPLGKQEE